MPGKKEEECVQLPRLELKEGDMIGDVSTEGNTKGDTKDTKLTVKFIITTFIYK